MTKFLRRDSNRYLKLGRKKKKVWRRPTGRDNKMREKRKGYPIVVSIGYKKSKNDRKKYKIINNLNDLERVKKNDLVIFGKIGKKKKIEMTKRAESKKIQIYNLNINKFLKKIKMENKNELKEEKSSSNKNIESRKK